MNIAHRDLKPENIFVVPGAGSIGEFVKVIDFGIAKMKVVQGAEALTNSGVIIGTPQYLSPEQAMGLEVDEKSDIYSLAVMVYEMLVGVVPLVRQTPIQPRRSPE